MILAGMMVLSIFQFPPPRGGEPKRQVKSKPLENISIPAPARGRTRAFRDELKAKGLFQFPPPRGGERG